MKKTLISLLLLLPVLCCHAQLSADQLLAATIEKTKSYQQAEIQFKYVILNAESEVIQDLSGTGFIKNNAYKVIIPDHEIICDGKLKWVYLVNEDEVMLSQANEDGSSFSPIDIINQFTEGYKASFVNRPKVAENLKVLKLKSSKDDLFSEVIMTINETTLQPVSLTATAKDGSQNNFEIKSIKTDVNYPDSFFVFDETKFPNVEVIDMR